VRAHGAKGDGKTKDTAAIQQAIEAAAASGGGTIHVPAGRYLSGTLHLRSNTTLHLDNGAVLLASPDDRDFDPYETLPFQSVSDRETTYFHQALLAADGAHDIAIVGEGVVDGNRSKRGGPKTIAIKLSQRVTIRGVTVRNSPNYSISFWGCDWVNVDGVHVENGYADGIDPDSSRYVRISNSYIDAYDDAICPKASPSMGMDRRRPVEHLTVTNCVLRTNCSNFKFGTESSGDFRHIAVSNITMLPRDVGRPPISGIALEAVDGAHIEGVAISNVSMQGVRAPIFLRLANRGRGLTPKAAGSLEDVSIVNVTARGASVASSITGIPEARIRRVSLDGIRVTYTGGLKDLLPFDIDEFVERYPEATMWGDLPAWALYTRHADGVTIRNFDAAWTTTDARPAIVADDVSDLVLEGFQPRSTVGPPVRLRNVPRQRQP
jgi:polygalacturonase